MAELNNFKLSENKFVKKTQKNEEKKNNNPYSDYEIKNSIIPFSNKLLSKLIVKKCEGIFCDYVGVKYIKLFFKKRIIFLYLSSFKK